MITPESFADDYSRYFAKTVYVLGSRGVKDAEEFAQGAWAQAWCKRENFRGECPFHYWVISIARWMFLYQCKLRKPLRQFPIVFEPSYIDRFAFEARHDIEVILGKVKPLYATALRRHFIDEIEACELGPTSAHSGHLLVNRAKILARTATKQMLRGQFIRSMSVSN